MVTRPTTPEEPYRTMWKLPPADKADSQGLVGVGADLLPGTLISAYRKGLFPMPMRRNTIGWWSPDPRGIIPVDGLIVSRSTRASARRFEIRHDTNFAEVMRGCGDSKRPHGWINDQFIAAYTQLFELGWASSTEVYLDDALVGGVYGVRINRFYAGESMFHTVTDASKVALTALVDRLQATGATLFDVQWTTPHLRSLGAIDVSRDDYVRQLTEAIEPGETG